MADVLEADGHQDDARRWLQWVYEQQRGDLGWFDHQRNEGRGCIANAPVYPGLLVILAGGAQLPRLRHAGHHAHRLKLTDGGTLYVSVVLNGKYAQEMVLDSGANMISLPQGVAEKCGVEVKPSDPKVILGLADGRRITGRLVVILSVRVGKFTVTNVEAAVLGPEAASAEPLLGMTFLGNFKFEVDANKSTLTMAQVDVSVAR